MSEEIMRALGRIEGKVDTGFSSMEGHISAVSAKADSIRADLNTHKESDCAHGAGTRRRMLSGIADLIVKSIVIGGGIFAFFLALHKAGILAALAQAGR
jgi:hypothetical protein